MAKFKHPEPRRDSSVTPQGQARPEKRPPHGARDLSSGKFARTYDKGENFDMPANEAGK